MFALYASLFIISAASLIFEIGFTRIFSIKEWYHFAFMMISVAMLGFGASGSVLSVFPKIFKKNLRLNLAIFSSLFAFISIAAYLVINYVPFDSYVLAWDRLQILYLFIHYLVLTLPFFFTGLIVSAAISAYPEEVGKIYFSSLAGSGIGCLIVVLALPALRGSGLFILIAILAIAAALLFKFKLKTLLICFPAIILMILYLWNPAIYDIRPSPYKDLSQVLRYPQTRKLTEAWDATSKVDIVESSAIKRAPGLSLAYKKLPPEQLGITIDGDNLSPIPKYPVDKEFAEYFLQILPYKLKTNPSVLIVEPRGGLDVRLAQTQKLKSLTVVESNPLVARQQLLPKGVGYVVSGVRNYLARPGKKEGYDVIHLSLSDSFKPITAGTYSLSENYLYTEESFQALFNALSQDGILSIQRWLQLPPAELPRVGSIATQALRKSGIADPSAHITAIRGWSVGSVLVKKIPWTSEEITAIKEFCSKRRFDLVYYPGIKRNEVNLFNVLPEPYYFDVFAKVFQERDFKESVYDISSVSDNNPFYFHFFKWRNLPLILQEWGKTWQPFGGGGYVVLVLLLVIAAVVSAIFILFPLYFLKRKGRLEQRWRFLTYFFALGLGFLFIEIPLMQKFILFLGHPIYALSVVLFSILLFSGLGSLTIGGYKGEEKRILFVVIPVLIILLLIYLLFLDKLFCALLGCGLLVRVGFSILVLLPIGFVMGAPFPLGIRVVNKLSPKLIPWAWGVNGFASVISSILAVMLAISFGFSQVLILAGVVYLIGFLVMLGI